MVWIEEEGHCLWNFYFIQDVKVYGKGNKYKIIALDCGIKQNMIRSLLMVLDIHIFSMFTPSAVALS